MQKLQNRPPKLPNQPQHQSYLPTQHQLHLTSQQKYQTFSPRSPQNTLLYALPQNNFAQIHIPYPSRQLSQRVQRKKKNLGQNKDEDTFSDIKRLGQWFRKMKKKFRSARTKKQWQSDSPTKPQIHIHIWYWHSYQSAFQKPHWLIWKSDQCIRNRRFSRRHHLRYISKKHCLQYLKCVKVVYSSIYV